MFQIPVLFVASYAHSSTQTYCGEWKYVDSYKEAADLYILNHAKRFDVVVTQDIGLASMLVNQKVYAISPRGKIFNESDMDTSLHLRFLAAKERRSGRYTKGPKPFTNHDRIHFTNSLKKILSKLAGILE